MSNNNVTEAEAEKEQPDNEAQDEGPRRSNWEIRQPDYFGREQGHLTEMSVTLEDATISPDKEKWKAAMDMQWALHENDVWDLKEHGWQKVGVKEKNRYWWHSRMF